MIDQTFTGTLGLDDMARHISHIVEVPAGAGTLRAALTHAPHHPGIGPLPHQISLSIHGPAGARGTRHNNADQSPVISENWASPGYTPGAIEPGAWDIQLDTHRILPPGGVEYRLRIWTEVAPVEGPEPPAPGRTAPRGAGWYLGDLHGHSDHSDGRWSVAEFIADARARGLDFVTLTDHNTVSGQAQARALADDGLLVMVGIELTTFHGHCLALGADRWIDWRIRDGQTMAARAAEVMAAGHVYVIAHPMSEGHPWCTGCRWAYADVFPGPARVVEVWNGPWKGAGDGLQNVLGLMLFESWLDQGHLLRATAGSDIHGPRKGDAPLGHNRVWATDLTQAAILEGVRAGRTCLTSGPLLDLWAQTAAGRTDMGGLIEPEATDADLGVAWSQAPTSARLSITMGGPEGRSVLHEAAIPAAGSLSLRLATLPQRGWVMARLSAPDGTVLALTNPIFFPGSWT